MAWFEVDEMTAARDRAQKALAAPIGLMSPLWFAFGAAASAGVAWWLMTRWTMPGMMPVNMEAMFGVGKAEAAPEPAPDMLLLTAAPASLPAIVETSLPIVGEAPPVATIPEPAPVVAAPAPEPVEVDSPVAVAELVETDSPVAVAEQAADSLADDFSRLAGVGPKISQALAQRGVTRFAHLAAWTADELAAFDAELRLNGRAIRADFIGQAKRLLETDV
jgi:predicted flap endonuclease-1-like 5' DNA nuclease